MSQIQAQIFQSSPLERLMTAQRDDSHSQIKDRRVCVWTRKCFLSAVRLFISLAFMNSLKTI